MERIKPLFDKVHLVLSRLDLVSSGGTMKAYFGLALAVALVAAASGKGLPLLPTTYMVSGTIELPYAGIVEPYEAWVDPENRRSRIDSYNGLASIVYLGKSGDYGRMLKTVYETTEKFINRRTCFETNGTSGAAVTMQGVIPDLTGFTYIGEKPCTEEGILNCFAYEMEEVIGAKMNRYTFKTTKAIFGDNEFPFEFHFLGYDKLFGSHYDEYIVRYKGFHAVSGFGDDIFEVTLPCGSYPGPGLTAHSEGGLFEHLAPFSRGVDRIDRAFSDFKAENQRSYSTDAEHFERARNFRGNHQFVESMNRRNLTYKLRLNHLADMSQTERKATMFGLKRTAESANPPNALKFVPKNTVESIPSAHDWRIYGAVTPVKDQAICGSCWSFSTTGVIEGALFLHTKKLVELSQQNMMDCTWGEGNNACDGGEQFRAYEWIMAHGGIATAESYGPYLMQDGKCHFANATVGAQITGYVKPQSFNGTALQLALLEQPVAVNIDASHKSFGFYGHGVYYEPECGNLEDQLDHAVLAVGFGTLDGEDYWIVKNSWSTHWGNAGYILMSQKNNNCGVATDSSFVKMD